MKYLDGYLALRPRDLEAMDLRARLLAESARSVEEIDAASRANDYVLRQLDPKGHAAQEVRRRLVELYLLMEQVPGAAVRYGTAEVTARILIDLGNQQEHPDPRDYRLHARALLVQERYGKRGAKGMAIEEFERAARLDPGDVAGAEQLAFLDVDYLKDRDRAERVLDALLKAAPTPEARLARARHFVRFGPPRKVRQELDRAVAESPANALVRLAAAEDALDRGDTAAARAHLGAIPAKDRGDVRVRLVTGVLELSENHAADAIASWRLGLRQAAGTSAALSFRLAWVLLQLGRVEEAGPLMDQFRRLAGGAKPPPESLYLEALRESRKGDPAAALKILGAIRTTIDRRLRHAVLMTMAQCYEAARDEPRALEAYRAAAAAQPRLGEAYLNSARLLNASRGPEAAADELRQALRQAPDDPALLIGSARLMLRQRRFGAMKAALDRAAAVGPATPTLVLLQADYLSGIGRLDEAVARVGEAAERLDRRDVTLWVAYANGLARQGRVEVAMEALERAAAPDAAGDRAALRIARARLLQEAGRGRQARQELANDFNRLPPADRPPVLHARADLLIAQGDRTAALATLRRWSELTPDDPQPALMLLEMALDGDDAATAAEAIKALKAVRRGEGAYEAIGLAYEALRGGGLDSADRLARLDEAGRLLDRVKALAAHLPQGPLMRGLLLEEKARDAVLAGRDRDKLLDDAILAYQKALDDGGTAAVPRLIELLTRRRRPAELTTLRKRMALDHAFDRMNAEASLKFGLAEEADRIARRVVEADPEGLDASVLQAAILKRLGRPDDAEEALCELAKARPGDPGPWLQLLVFQVGRNRRDAAEATLAQIVRNVKGERPEFLYAQAYKLAGDLKKAGELFQEALRKWPDDPVVARGVADFHEAAGRPAEAEAALRRVLARDPAAGWAARKLALILSARPRDAAAWKEATRLVAAPAGPAADRPEDRLARAVVLSRSPDPAVGAAAVPLLRALKDDLPPGDPIGRAARERLARYFLEADRPAEAWKSATDALGEEAEPSADAVTLYAEVLLRNRKPEEAAAQVDRLAKLEPNGLRAEALRGRVLAARGKAEEADATLEAAYRTREQAPDAQATAGIVLAALTDLNRLDAAERVARREAELRPGNAGMLARVLARRGRPKDALDACREAIRAGGSRTAIPVALALAKAPGATPETLQGVDDILGEALTHEPEAVELALPRAQVRHLQGRFEDELNIFRDVQRLRPGDHGYLNNWAWTLSESLHKPAEALDLIDEAIKRSGRYPVYLDTRGVILARLERLGEAIPLLEESAPYVGSGQGFFHLARALHQAGQDTRARESLARARAAGLKTESMEAAERRDFEGLDASLLARGAPAAAPPRP